MRMRFGIVLAGLMAATGPAVAASEQPSLVIACRGTFYDLGDITPQESLYRIKRGDVQVWDASNNVWLQYPCVGYCLTSPTSVSVNDGYTTKERGFVYHTLDLRFSTGHLLEAWRVGTDVIEFRAGCAEAADPAPGSMAIEPSTRGDDYTLYSIAKGLPLPVPRRAYELRLAPYRSTASIR